MSSGSHGTFPFITNPVCTSVVSPRETLSCRTSQR